MKIEKLYTHSRIKAHCITCRSNRKDINLYSTTNVMILIKVSSLSLKSIDSFTDFFFLRKMQINNLQFGLVDKIPFIQFKITTKTEMLFSIVLTSLYHPKNDI
jgi:hypothetical protein